MSQETEHEQRHRIAEMEKDITSIDDLQGLHLKSLGYISFIMLPGQYESALIKLSNAETQIEHLKSQLDATLGAEEMLVQLTERNLMLSEVSVPVFWQLIGPPEMEHRKLKKCGSLLKTSKLSKSSMTNSKKTIWKPKRPCKKILVRNRLPHFQSTFAYFISSRR